MTTTQQDTTQQEELVRAPREQAVAEARERPLPVWGLVTACVVASLGVVAIGLGAVWLYEAFGPARSFRNSHLQFFGAISAGLGVLPLFGAIGYLIVKDREWFTWMLILTAPLLIVAALVVLT